METYVGTVCVSIQDWAGRVPTIAAREDDPQETGVRGIGVNQKVEPLLNRDKPAIVPGGLEYTVGGRLELSGSSAIKTIRCH